MQSRRILAGLALGSAMLVGCEERPQATPSPRQAPNTTGTGTTTTDQNAQARAQTLIDQVKRNIGAGNYDAAEASVRELESMKSSLPSSMQSQISSLRSQLDSFKVGAGAKPPATTPPSTTPPEKTPPDGDENP